MKTSKGFLFFLAIVLLLAGCSMEDAPAPVAKIAMTGSNCAAPCAVTFSDVSENTSVYEWAYAWEFGDGEKSADKNPVHTYKNGGSFKVRFTVTGKYGVSTDTATVVIKGTPGTVPVAKFTVTGGDCEAPCEVTFKNESEHAVSYEWRFGDKSKDSISTEANPKHKFETAGKYNVRLTATGPGGSKSTSVEVTIKPASSVAANFTWAQDTTKMDSVMITFANKSTGATKYDWDFGDGKKSVEKDPLHKYARLASKDTIYVVTLKATGAADASKSKSDTLKIKKRP